MRIIYHFRVKGVGPERVHISGIAGAFQALGHRVGFVSPTDINPLTSGDVQPERGLLRSIFYFLSDKAPQLFFELMEILYNGMAFGKLRRAIREMKPDLIYERYAFFCCVGTYLARKCGIPLVLEVNEVGGLDRVRPQTLVRLSRIFEKYIFSNADVIVTVSGFLRDRIVERGGNADRILVIPNGIDMKLFRGEPPTVSLREKYGVEGKRVIGFVGYLVHWHRLDLLISVFAEIKDRYPDTLLVLTGDGVLRPELQKLSRDLGVSDSLIITGRVDHSEIPQHIDLFDIAVIPNSNEYRSPIKLFEYMAMGKAVVAPDLPPIVSIIEDGKTGFIFKNGDAADLYRSIRTALDSEEACCTMGANARELATSSYTWDIHAAKILSSL